MKTIFVSRHRGAAEWAARHGFEGVQVVSHFTPNGEPVRVIGTLPVHLAAQVCAAGGEYWHLSLDIPADARGRELTADEMESFGAQVERFLALSMPEFYTRAGRVMKEFNADGLAWGHNLHPHFGLVRQTREDEEGM